MGLAKPKEAFEVYLQAPISAWLCQALLDARPIGLGWGQLWKKVVDYPKHVALPWVPCTLLERHAQLPLPLIYLGGLQAYTPRFLKFFEASNEIIFYFGNA